MRGPHPHVPPSLTSGVFTVAQARRAGVTWHQLQGLSWRRVHRGIYTWAGSPESPKIRLEAIARLLPAGSAFSGGTAAWLHGLDVSPVQPCEVTVPAEFRLSGGLDLVFRRGKLEAADVVTRAGWPATSIARTLIDLSRTRVLLETVIVIELALRAGLVSPSGLSRLAAAAAGAHGIRRFREAIDLAEPRSESPYETRLRMLLISRGLPRPESQVSLHDARGRFLGRTDLYYRAAKLCIEFDGGAHRESLIADNRRQNLLINERYRVLRFTAPDVLARPDVTVAQVRAALASSRAA